MRKDVGWKTEHKVCVWGGTMGNRRSKAGEVRQKDRNWAGIED